MVFLKKKQIKLMMIILCYRETEDVIVLMDSLKDFRDNVGILLVNSYYDEKSKKEIESNAIKYNCDFINIENKGYGYGNNRGLDYINNYYDYEFVCICNPDVEFNKISMDILSENYFNSIIAPIIVNKKQKKQNPYYYFNSPLVNVFKQIGLVNRVKFPFYVSVLINKIYRKVFDFIYSKNEGDIEIYACHGSCFFIGYQALSKLSPLFLEEMFLFNEEEHIAKQAKLKGIPIYMNKDIQVVHYEDGSSSGIESKTFEYLCDSYTKLYNYWKYKVNN